MKYRRKIDIVADILNVAKNGARKTQIMYKGNLSYKLLNKYLNMLIEANLIEPEDDSNYVITLKGAEFLEIFKQYKQRYGRVSKQISLLRKYRSVLERMCSNFNIYKDDNLNDTEKLKENVLT